MNTLNLTLTLTLVLLLFVLEPSQGSILANNKTTFQIGVLLPLHGMKEVGQEAIAAANLAVDYANQDTTDLPLIRDNGFLFDIRIMDTYCDTGKSLYGIVNMVTKLSNDGHSLDAFVGSGYKYMARAPDSGVYTVKHFGLIKQNYYSTGPSCDNVCETAGLLAKYWNIPMISFGCEESKLSNRNVYPTFLRTTSNFSSMGRFLAKILKSFGWTRLTLVVAGDEVWLETEDDFKRELAHDNYDTLSWHIRDEEWGNITKLLLENSKVTRVFVLCMFPVDVLRFMDASRQLGILNGQYVFFSLDFANMGKRTGHVLDGDHLEGLLDITMDVTPENPGYDAFIHSITENSTVQVDEFFEQDHVQCTHYEYGIHAGLLYDALSLYVRGLEITLADNADPWNGSHVVSHLYDYSFEGITGRVHINEDGSRDSLFMLHNLQHGCYLPIMRTQLGTNGIVKTNESIIWPGGTTTKPLGHPDCGWEGELCDESDKDKIIGAVVSLTILVIAGIIGFLYWRDWKRRRDSSRKWVIDVEDLKLKNKSRNGFDSSRNFSSVNQSFSRLSSSTEMSACQVFAEMFVYLGEDVAGKSLEADHKHPLVVTPGMSKEINAIMSIANANICKFYGVCLAPGHEMTVWEYCKKGSLQDVLNHDAKYLDDMPFKVSFINDITKGLRYLHHSSFGNHGRLKSSNVLVDNRWTCKLAHFCIDSMEKFRPKEEMNDTRLLAVAPEVLRNGGKVNNSKASDMYSYAIILLEIFTVQEIQELFSSSYALEQSVGTNCRRKKAKHKVAPDTHYFQGFHEQFPEMEETLEAKEIIKRVKHGGAFPFRPYIPDTVDLMMKSLIMECWRESPDERPSIDQAAPIIRRVSSKYTSKSKSLMEQMLDKVTREADTQAQELKEEKHKSDMLLYQMLPPMVADCLKKQIEVKPETFQAATVYFSDIQGFTEMVSVASPIEVVNFLNDVYYRFDTIIEKYRVYKVETIGDAYVVCSGVPLRIVMHATEIAKMALHISMVANNLQVLIRPDQRLLIRIGLHSGPVAAGVVGRTMPRYCLFGDTVNTASRMESTGLAGRIQISEQCKVLLENDDGFRFEERERIHVKGKGMLQNYFLLEKVGFNPLDNISSYEMSSSLSSNKAKPEGFRNNIGSDDKLRESQHKLSPGRLKNKIRPCDESPLSINSSMTIDGDLGIPVM